MTESATRGIVRRVRPGDEEQLFKLFRALAVAEGLARHFHPHPFDRATASMIATRSGCDVYLGFFRRGELLGYAMLRGWDEGFEVPAFGVAVAPAHQGKGVGGRLLTACLDEARARGAKRVMLKVHADNELALQWYLSAGFTKTGMSDDGQLVCELVLDSV
jgi:ribosomal protein S18 acetylase RimI-like enzyme